MKQGAPRPRSPERLPSENTSSTPTKAPTAAKKRANNSASVASPSVESKLKDETIVPLLGDATYYHYDTSNYTRSLDEVEI
jgi:hypothetical protein